MTVAVVEPPKLPAVLEHRSHGRIRVRVPRQSRTEGALRRVRKQLESHAAVSRVTMNPRSGSILVEGDDTDLLHSALQEVVSLFEQAGPGTTGSAGVDAAVNVVKRVDEKIGEMTGRRVSLRWLVPGAFIAVGIRQLFAQGFTVGTVPWYVVMYYGVDSFLKLYPEHAPRPGPQLRVVTGAGASRAGG